jgi:ferritin-like metal-binding protein YciE
MADTLDELFEHELRDLYDAEHKLVRALESMSKKTPDDMLAQGFRQHRDITKEQIKRLERVFEVLGKKPRREPCKGINGLVDEFTKFVKEEEPSDEVLNTFALGAGLKVEHYEIVAYESLLRIAGSIGLDDAIEPLQRNLIEERNTANELEALSDEMTGTLPGQEEDLGVVARTSDEALILPETEQINT